MKVKPKRNFVTDWFLSVLIVHKDTTPLTEKQLKAVDKEIADLQKDVNSMVETRLNAARLKLKLELTNETKIIGKTPPTKGKGK